MTCIDLNKEDADIVMIGTEAGAVFQGSLASETPAAAAAEDELGEVEWRDPISVVFSSHRGRVVDVRASPFHRDLFFSLGSDQEIRLHSLLSPHVPSHVIHLGEGGAAVAAMAASSSRPAVFAAAAADGTLRIFDLRANRAGPVQV